MSTSGAATPSCWKGKGSNERPSNTGACNIATPLPNIINQVSQSLRYFRPLPVSNHLTTDNAAHPERFVKGRSHPADLPRAVWINPPTKNTAAQDAPGTTIVIMDDLRVDQSRDADDHVAVMIVDRHATLITAPLVSQCH